MTDGELAHWAVSANQIELAARAAMRDGVDADEAAAVLRLAVPLRKAVEQVIISRAIRAQRADRPQDAVTGG